MKGYGLKRMVRCCPVHDDVVWTGNYSHRNETVERLERSMLNAYHLLPEQKKHSPEKRASYAEGYFLAKRGAQS